MALFFMAEYYPCVYGTYPLYPFNTDTFKHYRNCSGVDCSKIPHCFGGEVIQEVLTLMLVKGTLTTVVPNSPILTRVALNL